MTCQVGRRRAAPSGFRLSCAHARAPPTSAHPPAPGCRPGRAGAGRRAGARPDAATSETPKSTPTPAPTPIGQLNTDAMTLARVDFCALLPDPAVRKALGGGLGDQVSWRNGERAQIDTDTRDVAHEYGCAWTARTVRRQRVDLRAPDHLRVRQGGAREDLAPEGLHGRRPGPTSAARTGSRTAGSPTAPSGSGWPGCSRTPSSPARCRPRPKENDQTLAERADEWCVQVANATNIAR